MENQFICIKYKILNPTGKKKKIFEEVSQYSNQIFIRHLETSKSCFKLESTQVDWESYNKIKKENYRWARDTFHLSRGIVGGAISKADETIKSYLALLKSTLKIREKLLYNLKNLKEQPESSQVKKYILWTENRLRNLSIPSYPEPDFDLKITDADKKPHPSPKFFILASDEYDIKKINSRFYLALNLYDLTKRPKNQPKRRQLCLPLEASYPYHEKKYEDLLKNIAKKGRLEIHYREDKNQWYAYQAIGYPINKNIPVKTWVAVVLSYDSVALSTGDVFKSRINLIRKRWLRRRKALQKLGRRSRIKKHGNREKNQINWQIHNMVKFVLSTLDTIAVERPIGLICEDLKYLRFYKSTSKFGKNKKENWKINSFIYKKFHFILQYKCNLRNIPIQFVKIPSKYVPENLDIKSKAQLCLSFSMSKNSTVSTSTGILQSL
jgi:hypothetical protein